MVMENAKLKNNVLLNGKEKHEVEKIEKTKKPILFELEDFGIVVSNEKSKVEK